MTGPKDTGPKDLEGDVPTTGHSWDGIEEYDNPMPRWWLYTFYACIVWAIGYSIAYPAWPLISGATSGLLGYSTRGQVADEMASAEAANAEINAQLAAVDLPGILETPELQQYAFSKGAAVFRTNCSQCHGSGAAGAKGFPNLLDDDWLWGGTMEDIHATVTHGIRNTTDPEARYSEMPAFGDLLSRSEIAEAANYVQSLSGPANDPTLVAAGQTVFEENCTACHMDGGIGSRELGAPNLSDAVWLYGGDYDTLVATITNSRFGVMPDWGSRLTEADIRAVTTYVHQLGGGE
ncbi:cytochrome-c oxidase, cbb3-type subunit III [Pseudoruegeria sp. SK021]|uniref:cytochrome-c oxidase, cbb3-type subunit III n=1 Tax=Pseudoruegeria sp. SK021 TaxID=1933035 RepID=UPI000A241FAF|nr:cytochrome-c oxidase, cbb3-type subunit III [Pseudoruegeria sp. SK021]OSP56741.1 cytochrome-c oxidase, cbb3-type subunit III [Pseudoruegeria sp. SK021]